MTETKATHLKIWCDGGMQSNPGIGGYGVYGKLTNADTHEVVKRFTTSGGKLRSTNIEMEVLAVLASLNLALQYPDVQVIIYTDSQWTLKCMTGEFRVNEKHEAKISILVQLWDKCDRKRVKIKWVKGHAGNFGNELADSLATQAVQRMIHTRTEYGIWKQYFS